MNEHRDIARAQLKIDESTVEHAYQDSEGYWTIGTGRLIDKRKGGKLYPDEMALMLENDIIRAEADARVLFPSFDSLSANRRAVLVNMAFNLGRANLAAFGNLRAAVAAGDYEKAAAEMLDSRWAVQVGHRARRLAKQMQEGFSTLQIAIALGAIALLTAAVFGIYAAGKSAGRDVERAAWQARELEQQQAYSAAIAKLRAEKDGQLAALQGDLAKAQENYEIQKRRAGNEKAKNDRVAADLRAGRLVLRDPGATAGEACGSQGPAGAAAPAHGDGAAAKPGGLSSELSAFLWAEATRADEVIEDLEARLTLAQDVVGAYYRMARDCSVAGN